MSSGQKIFYIQFLRLFPCFVLFFGLFVFGKVDNSSESDDMSYYYEYQNYDYLSLMLLLLIIIKCWMLSFMVCSSFFWIFYILYKKKKAFILCLVVDSKPWGFYQSFIVPVYAFSVVFAFIFISSFFFFYQGGKHIHCQTSLLDID